MPLPFDFPPLIWPVLAAVAAIALACHYILYRRSGTGFFFYALAGNAALAMTVLATAFPGEAVAAAVADFGLLAAGIAGYAASRWLDGAFSMAGDRDER
jgi:hypothetical protein